MKRKTVILLLVVCFLASCAGITSVKNNQTETREPGKFLVSYPLKGDIVTDEDGGKYYVVKHSTLQNFLDALHEQSSELENGNK